MKATKIFICFLTLLLSCNSVKKMNETEESRVFRSSFIFELSEKITDEKLFDKKLNKVIYVLDSMLNLSRKSEFNSINTPTFKLMFDPRKRGMTPIESHLIVEDSILNVFTRKINKFKNSFITSNHKKINIVDYTYHNLSAKDTLTSYGVKEKLFFKDESNIIEVTEFRNDRKIIESYNCFKVKVILSNKLSFSGIELTTLLDEFKYKYYEMYVTEDIGLPYHPHIQYKSLLEKYYPLEVIEYNDILKGYIRYSVLNKRLEM